MKQSEVLDILRLIGVSEDQTLQYPEKQQMSICCPLAPWMHEKRTDSNPSLSIRYSDTQPTLFKCFACGEKGKLWQLVDSYAELAKKPELKVVADNLLLNDKPTLEMSLNVSMSGVRDFIKIPRRVQTIALNPKVLERFPRVQDVPTASDYLISRRITLSMWSRFNLRYDPTRHRIVFPVYDRRGRLVGGVGRLLPGIDHPAKYYNYFGFEASHCLGGANYLKTSFKRTIIVEGYMCLLKGFEWCQELETNICCTFHGEMSNVQAEDLVSLDMPMWFWYDNDKAGNTGWIKAEKLLRGKVPGLKRAKLPISVDVGKMSKEEFLSHFEACRKEF